MNKQQKEALERVYEQIDRECSERSWDLEIRIMRARNKSEKVYRRQVQRHRKLFAKQITIEHVGIAANNIRKELEGVALALKQLADAGSTCSRGVKDLGQELKKV